MDQTTTVVARYIVTEFLPDIGPDELPHDYDLLATGVIDSLALLRVVSWLGERFGLPVDEVDIAPDNFRTVADISAFVESCKELTK